MSILHLLLWTTCSAAYLALMRALLSQRDIDAESPFVTLQQGTNIIFGMHAGVVLTGAIILVAWRLRAGPPLLRQPGHWILFVSAAINLLYLPLLLLSIWLGHSNQVNNSYMVVWGVIMLLPPIAYGAAVVYCEHIRWRVVFAGFAVAGVLRSVHFLAISLSSNFPGWLSVVLMSQNLISVAVGIWMLVCCIVDLRRRVRRDWLHWIGVLGYLATAVINFMWLIVARLFV